MHTLQVTLRRIVGCGIVGAIAVPVLAGGCSSSNSPGPTTMDASADQTSGMSSSSSTSSSQDASGTDTSVQDSSQPDTSSSTDASDSGHDASTDAADAANTSDATDASDASDAANDATQGSDAGDGSTCTTTVALLGSDGGVNEAGVAPTILFDFDTGATLDPAFTSFNDTGSTASLALTSADGYPCPGALALSVTYTAFGPTDGIYYNYGSTPQNWSSYTELHAWLKVVTTDFSTIVGVEPMIDSNNYVHFYCSFQSAGTLATAGTADGWHEVIVPLNTTGAGCSGTYDGGMVNGFEFKLETTSSSEDGSAAPPPATMLVDSIWLQ